MGILTHISLKLQNAQGSNEKDSMIHTFFYGWYKNGYSESEIHGITGTYIL